jgi:hypothetical protein
MTETAGSTKAAVGGALTAGKRKTGAAHPRPGGLLLQLQRSAGNAAVNALLAAKLKGPDGDARTSLDAALGEMRRDEPAVNVVEKGLKAAKSLGIPVELEGPKPPASALAATVTGFGPNAVPAKKPVPPPKRVPAVSPLGKAAAKRAKPAAATGKAAGGGGAAGPAAGAAIAPSATALSADQLMQPPVPPKTVAPQADAAFTQVTGGVKSFAKDKKSHQPAAAKAKQAQDAALAPSDDLVGQAKAAKVDTMDAQQPGTFDKKAFIASVKAAIEAKSPKTLEEADDQAKAGGGKAGEVKGEVKGLVSQGKEGQTKDVATATAAAPDTSTSLPKPVTPIEAETQGSPAAIPATGAAPKPAPPEQLNLAAGKQQTNDEMAGADVSEHQLAESNEPEFQQALSDKKAAAAHADSAPGQFRKQEQGVIAQQKAEAAAVTKQGVAGMQSSKASALAKLVAAKGKTKSKDEAKRAEVTAKVQSIYAGTETAVKKILDGIDPKVDKAFEEGEADARKTFETYVAAKMSAYKKDRYSGWLGGFRWAKDKLVGMPDKVNTFYTAGRELYLKKMDSVISNVADIVGGDLAAAKAKIAAGKAEITSYVKSLPANLQKVGDEAAKEIDDKFAQLEDDVNAKQEAVVDTLATKYVDARKGLDERIEELQAENKGLVDKAIGAIKAVINTIRQLASMLMNVLARVAGVIGDIIKRPVAFLSNLIDGVKGGILKFKDNILDHLRKGLMSWLFGALAEGGVELPDTFDLKGIVKLLASLFGLTWRNIRNRLVKQIGEPAMAAIEKGVEIFQLIASGGVAALWQMLVEKLGDIKEMILEQVKDFVITRIITAGITWLIGLLNPAAAFIKACKLIYDIVMFFVNNAERIMKFVNTVIDSVADIVGGNVSGVVSKIEGVLGQMVPILIGFLASAIGLGGVGQKIREIVGKLQKPVNKAIDFLIKQGLKLAGPIIRGLKGIGKKVKAKVAAGKAWVKGKVDAGKKWVKGKAEAAKKWAKSKLPGAKKDKEQKEDKKETPTSKGVKEEAKSRVLAALSSPHKRPDVDKALGKILKDLGPKGLKSLKMGDKRKDGSYPVVAVASPPEVLLAMAPRGRAVRMIVTLTVTGTPLEGVTPQPRPSTRFDDNGRPVSSELTPAPLPATNIEGKGGKSRGIYGGRLIPTEAGSDKVEVVTWNTGERDWAVASNASHAEAQFNQWALKEEHRQLLSRTRNIDIQMYDWNPCLACASDLNRVRGWLPPNATGTVTYRAPYPGESGVALLERAGWLVRNLADGPPVATQELQAAGNP